MTYQDQEGCPSAGIPDCTNLGTPLALGYQEAVPPATRGPNCFEDVTQSLYPCLYLFIKPCFIKLKNVDSIKPIAPSGSFIPSLLLL